MPTEVREYFRSHPAGEGRAEAAGTKLARAGIHDMEALCELLESDPERVRQIRDIGPKSMELIQRVCKYYRKESTVQKSDSERLQEEEI